MSGVIQHHWGAAWEQSSHLEDGRQSEQVSVMKPVLLLLDVGRCVGRFRLGPG